MLNSTEIEISKKRCIKTLNSKWFKNAYIKFDEEISKCSTEKYNIAYNHIINKTIKLMRNELKLEDAIDISLVYRYMLLNGYFSKNNIFEFTDKNLVREFSNYGADIMRGRGVCLNVSTMLNDILNNYGIESYRVGCDLSYTIERFSYKRFKKYYNSLLPKIYDSIIGKTFISGSHAAVLTKTNGNMFVIDPTYSLYYHFIAFLVATDSNSSIICDIKPFSCGLFFGVEPEKMLKILLETESHNYIDSIQSTNILIEKKEYYSDLCANKTKLFEEFHNDIDKEINVVCKTLKK